jgi:hypothetical protein
MINPFFAETDCHSHALLLLALSPLEEMEMLFLVFAKFQRLPMPIGLASFLPFGLTSFLPFKNVY